MTFSPVDPRSVISPALGLEQRAADAPATALSSKVAPGVVGSIGQGYPLRLSAKGHDPPNRDITPSVSVTCCHQRLALPHSGRPLRCCSRPSPRRRGSARRSKKCQRWRPDELSRRPPSAWTFELSRARTQTRRQPNNPCGRRAVPGFSGTVHVPDALRVVRPKKPKLCNRIFVRTTPLLQPDRYGPPRICQSPMGSVPVYNSADAKSGLSPERRRLHWIRNSL